MRRSFQSIGVLALVVAIPAIVAAQAVFNFKDAVAAARQRYAGANTIQTRFEGWMESRGQRIPLADGAMYYRRADAFRHEFSIEGNKRVTLRLDDKQFKFKLKDGKAIDIGEERPKGPIAPQFPPAFESFVEDSFQLVDTTPAAGNQQLVFNVKARFKTTVPFAAARMGIEDGTWLVRTLDLLDAKDDVLMSIRFTDVRLNQSIPDGVLTPPKPR